MIPCDFIYLQPASLQEAAEAWKALHTPQRPACYYGGGSEIITRSRAGSIKPGAVIDLKAIPACRALSLEEERIALGAAATLNEVKESGLFPLLGKACGRVADHTNQCRITLGGNLSGNIRYRETVLPLLLADARAILYGPEGEREAALSEIFREQMRYRPGEFLVRLEVDAQVAALPYAHVKKTANEKIDYPLVNITALLAGGRLRLAFSGVCAYPFRSKEMEEALNADLPLDVRVAEAAKRLPALPMDNGEGSAAYRLFMLKNTLYSLLQAWESGKLEEAT